MSHPRMRIVTLLARHGTTRYPSALRDIQTLFAQQMPEVAHETVVIDNALSRDHHERIATGITLIGGDNSSWEFSAWDCGIRSLGARLDSYDFIHLATSAFRQLYVRYLDRFDADMLGLVRGRAAATGHVDFFNEPVTLFGRTVQSWLRSSFVFMPPVELRLMGSLVSVTDRTALFSGDPVAPFRADAPVSPGNRSNILGWLTGSGTGQAVEWHSKIALSDATLGFFEDKTVAILNEQMLTSRLQAQGCCIADATWLATRAEATDLDARPLQALPDWRQQVASRDVDAAPAALVC